MAHISHDTHEHVEANKRIKVKPVFPEYKELFMCKRCGCTIKREVSVTAHKFGGYGLGAVMVVVCPNCLYGSEYEF